MRHKSFSLAVGLIAGFAIRTAPFCCATDSRGDHPSPSAYLAVGVSGFETVTGTHDAFAYTLGIDYPLKRWLSIDAGFADFGTAYEPQTQVYSLLEFTPWNGSEHRRRASYALPMVHWQPTSWLRLSGGAGPAVVFTRTRSYSVFWINPKISRIGREHARTEVFAKVSLDVRLTNAWSLGFAAFGTSSDGYSFHPVTGERSLKSDSVAVTLGLKYSGDPTKRRADETRWSAEAGPVISAFSYHANYKATPIGYDISIAYKRPTGIFAAIGHTEFGIVSQRPRYRDGTPLRTPPFNDFYPNGDLRVTSGSTHAMLGFERPVGGRLTFGLAAGPARTVASFIGVKSMFGTEGRYLDVADKVTMIGQAHARWKLHGGWHAKLSVRYTEIQGPQITFPAFEPDFGNTKVRILSFIPALSLNF